MSLYHATQNWRNKNKGGSQSPELHTTGTRSMYRNRLQCSEVLTQLDCPKGQYLVIHNMDKFILQKTSSEKNPQISLFTQLVNMEWWECWESFCLIFFIKCNGHRNPKTAKLVFHLSRPVKLKIQGAALNPFWNCGQATGFVNLNTSCWTFCWTWIRTMELMCWTNANTKLKHLLFLQLHAGF